MKYKCCSLLLSLFVMLFGWQTVVSQGTYETLPCDGDLRLKLVVDTSQFIDTQSICEASKSLRDKHVKLFIYMTDKGFDSEASWYEHLDQIEKHFGIQDANGEIPYNNFAIEISTVNIAHTTRGWGWGFALHPSNGVWSANPNAESELIDIKLSMQNDYQQLGLNETLSRVLSRLSAIQTTPPTATPFVPTPVVVNQTQVQVDTRPVMEGLGSFGRAVFLLVIFGLGIWGFIMFWRRYLKSMISMFREILLMRRESTTIRRFVSPILTSADTLFASNTLMSLWGFHGGRESQFNDEFEKLLRSSSVVLESAMSDFTSHTRLGLSWNYSRMTAIYQSWRTLFVVLIGSNPENWKMNVEDIKKIFDFVSLTTEQQSDDPLIGLLITARNQVQNLNQQSLAYPTGNFENEIRGVMDRVIQAKQMLAHLQEAQQKAQPLCEEVVLRRDQLVELAHVPNLVYAHVNQLIEQINTSLQTNNRVRAYELAMQVSDSLEEISEISASIMAINEQIGQISDPKDPRLPTGDKLCQALMNRLNLVYSTCELGQYETARNLISELSEDLKLLAIVIQEILEALQLHDQQVREVEVFIQEGFRFPKSITILLTNANQAIEQISLALLAGEYPLAREHRLELSLNSNAYIVEAGSIVSLRNRNQGKIEELSYQVTQLTVLLEKATPEWGFLSRLPTSNHGSFGSVIGNAKALIERLFDNPEDPDDLMSEIANANSMAQQEFTSAERELENSFKELAEQEADLQALVAHAKVVQAIQANLLAQADSATKSLAEIYKFIAEHDQFISPEIDTLLTEITNSLQVVRNLYSANRFLEAEEEFSRVRQTLTEAWAYVRDQVDQYNRALEELQKAQKELDKLFRELKSIWSGSPQTAFTAQTASQVETAINAVQAVSTITTRELGHLEDFALLAELTRRTTHANHLRAQVEAVINRLNADLARHLKDVEETNKAIQGANRAIASAQATCADSDSGVSARGLLAQAEQIIPNKPETEYMGNGELFRMRELAKQAQTFADQAKSSADTSIRQARRRREESDRPRPTTSTYNPRPAWQSSGGSSSSTVSRPASSSTVSRPASAGTVKRI